MAFLLKNSNVGRTVGPVGNGQVVIEQLIHIKRPAAVVAQSTTQQIFRVYGGEILVKKLYAKVTTIMSATDAQLSMLSKALDASGVAVGTALTISSVAATSANKEVGSFLFVPAAGSAAIWSTAGGSFGVTTGQQILPQGEIYESAAASSTTGSLEWHIFYQPLTEGAYVVAVAPLTAAI